ncbi:MAG: aspartate-semialdehyde dehydrogenase [Acholeplasmatales bacterium]|nr:aspartate-semialdehyde dehydrogenase [Acholeplasmatales bacterium]
MNYSFNVAIIGATGMVGQRFITLLNNHPWFHITILAASSNSKGLKYSDAVEGRWKMESPIPDSVKDMIVLDAKSDMEYIASKVDFAFCAVNMKKEEIRDLEEAYARLECPIVSNNSAHRFTDDVPMIIPEINDSHLKIIEVQRNRLGTKKGFIAVKSNCSLQSYVPALAPLLKYGIEEVSVSTYQAISGAGKTFDTFPDILDNCIPFISGEEEKSEQEPLKIFGYIDNNKIVNYKNIKISATCVRVPVSDGHLATVSVKFKNKPNKEDIIAAWKNYSGEPQRLHLPSAPLQFLNYFEEDNRPQTKLDRNLENGMAISLGRLRKDNIFDYKFVGLSHNTLRGAAGGAVLLAELLVAKGYIC